MLQSISSAFARLAKEPPFRLLTKAALSLSGASAKTRALWDISPRPQYLLGIWTAAQQAKKQKVRSICAIEFGVAGGNGLVAMQQEAEAVERETGVEIKVYGFDNGSDGLPPLIGDYRDHPDVWQPGDFPMNEELLRSRLKQRTTLILGNVSRTVPDFFEKFSPPPIGFVSVDVDLYSSSRDALQIFGLPNKEMLWHVPVYFDDIGALLNHKYAGELLAIDEFNETYDDVKIDKWYGIKSGRPFTDPPYLDRIYVAHDLTGITAARLDREATSLALQR